MYKKISLVVLFVTLSLFSLQVSVARADSIVDTITTGSGPSRFAVMGSNVYVANSSGNSVTVIDTLHADATSTIGIGGSPRGLIAIGTKIYVANYDLNSVVVIDTASGNATSSISVGSAPENFVAIGTMLYVNNYVGGSVTAINTASGNATTTIGLGSFPEAMLVIGSKIYITSLATPSKLYVIDTASGNATSSIAVTSAYAIAAIGSTIYLPDFNGHVNVVDTANGNATSSIGGMGSGAYKIIALGTKLYVTDYFGTAVSIIDTANSNTVTSVATGRTGYAIANLGSKIYIANNADATVSVIDTAKNNSVTTVSVGSSPMTFATLGTRIYVANGGSATVSVIAQQYTLNYVAGSNGSISGSSTQAIGTGSNGTQVTAVPANGYHFVNWSDASTANPRTDASVTGDVSVTANFAANPVVVAPSSASNLGGTASISDLAKILAPGPATDAYLASRGYHSSGVVSISTASPVSNNVSATPSSTALFTTDILAGSVNPDVKRLQQYFNTHGYVIATRGIGSLGKETDSLGTHTSLALKKFQKAHGIPMTGNLGSATRAAINAGK